jgi:hypothetical protein
VLVGNVEVTGAPDFSAPGLISHSFGTADDGTFVVQEVWSSRAEQGVFMESRLGAARPVAPA